MQFEWELRQQSFNARVDADLTRFRFGLIPIQPVSEDIGIINYVHQNYFNVIEGSLGSC